MEPLLNEDTSSHDIKDGLWGSSAFYLNKMQETSKPFKKDEEVYWFEKFAEAKGEEKEEIFEKIYTANIRMAIAGAKRFSYILGKNPSVEFMDLVHEGITGIKEAINNFDIEKGYKFSTYCYWWIFQAISRALSDHLIDIIKLPAYVNDNIAKLDKMLEETDGQKDLFLKKFRYLKEGLNSRNITSLNKKIGDDLSEVGDILADTNSSPLELAEEDEERERINEVLKELPPKQALIIELRFGLNGREKMTLEEVGEQLNLTRERVRQLEVKGMKKLKHPIRISRLKGFL